MSNQAFSKIWIVVILLAFIVGGILVWQYFRVPKEEGKAPEEISDWVKELITNEESGPVANPPASLIRCEYKNQIVYYLPPRCCDIPSILYNDSGDVICAPDGGFTGKGDGRCPDFFEARKDCEVIWEDLRKEEEVKAPPETPKEKISIVSPTKGKVWEIGRSYQIRWGPTNPTETVTIQLLDLQKRGTYQTVWSKKVPNTGQFAVSSEFWSDLYPIQYAQLYITNKLKGFSEGFSIVSAIEQDEWKTYRNEEYRLEIKYPPYCSIEELSPTWIENKEIERVSLIDIDTNCNIGIEVYTNPDNLPIDQWFNLYRSISWTGTDLIYEKPILIAGVKGTKGLLGCCANFSKAVALPKENKVYIISGDENIFEQTQEVDIWLTGELNESKDIFNQMLSTFRFLE